MNDIAAKGFFWQTEVPIEALEIGFLEAEILLFQLQVQRWSKQLLAVTLSLQASTRY